MDKQSLLKDLETYGSLIGDQESQGDELATNVIKHYSMWHQCPGDKCAQALTELSLKKWKEKQHIDGTI